MEMAESVEESGTVGRGGATQSEADKSENSRVAAKYIIMTWKEIIFICKPTLHCSPPCTTFPTYRLLPCPALFPSLFPPSIIGCRLKLAWNSAAGASFVAKFYWITRACLGSDQDLSLSLWHELRLMWHTDRGEAREESRSVGKVGGVRYVAHLIITPVKIH